MSYINKDGEIKETFLRTAYNYDMNAASEETGLECKDPTRAQQQFKEEVDINTIVERFGITGELPKDLRVPTNSDVWEIQDLKGAMNIVTEAREAFMQMPAHVRTTFDNDPAKFVDFVSDDDNRAKAERLGIIVKKEPLIESQD